MGAETGINSNHASALSASSADRRKIPQQPAIPSATVVAVVTTSIVTTGTGEKLNGIAKK